MRNVYNGFVWLCIFNSPLSVSKNTRNTVFGTARVALCNLFWPVAWTVSVLVTMLLPTHTQPTSIQRLKMYVWSFFCPLICFFFFNYGAKKCSFVCLFKETVNEVNLPLQRNSRLWISSISVISIHISVNGCIMSYTCWGKCLMW